MTILNWDNVNAALVLSANQFRFRATLKLKANLRTQKGRIKAKISWDSAEAMFELKTRV